MVKKFLRRWVLALPWSDRQFNELTYWHNFGRPLHLNPPVTFNEKIQWLKLYGSTEMCTSLVDKFAVREYVALRIGSQYLNELYGLFDHETDIDFDSLPQKFVLKATHGSGWNILCRDKSQFDVDDARKRLKKWLESNFYRVSRELNYKKIPPRIICERFLEDENKNLLDYKFFCFDGRVEVIQMDFDRYMDHTRNMYDRNWDLCPFIFIYPNNSLKLKRPENLEKMIEIAETLAGEMPFVRVDLYNLSSKIYFGEMTFTPESGLGKFEPAEWDYKLGTYLPIPEREVLKQPK